MVQNLAQRWGGREGVSDHTHQLKLPENTTAQSLVLFPCSLFLGMFYDLLFHGQALSLAHRVHVLPSKGFRVCLLAVVQQLLFCARNPEGIRGDDLKCVCVCVCHKTEVLSTRGTYVYINVSIALFMQPILTLLRRWPSNMAGFEPKKS